MDQDQRTQFGILLRLYRTRAGLTQAELAEKVGMSTKAIGSYETGERTHPQIETRKNLARELGLSEEESKTFIASTLPVRRKRKSQAVSQRNSPIGVVESTDTSENNQTDEGTVAAVPIEETAAVKEARPRKDLRLPAIMLVGLLLFLVSVGVRLLRTTEPTAAPMVGVALQQFGATFAPVGLALAGNEYTITPPNGDRRYAYLWGAYQPGSRCDTEVEFDVRIDGDTSSPGFGYAIAPRGTVTNDQPSGFSVQFEWDGSTQRYFIRPALLPSGARVQGETVVPASDVRPWHHIRVVALGGRD